MASLLPKVSAKVDELYTLRAERLEIQKKVDEIKDQEAEIKAYLVGQLSGSGRGIAGQLAIARLKVNRVASVSAWPKFYEYIRKNKAFELLQRRLNNSAVLDRYAEEGGLPGVGIQEIEEISITKLGEE